MKRERGDSARSFVPAVLLPVQTLCGSGPELIRRAPYSAADTESIYKSGAPNTASLR